MQLLFARSHGFLSCAEPSAPRNVRMDFISIAFTSSWEGYVMPRKAPSAVLHVHSLIVARMVIMQSSFSHLSSTSVSSKSISRNSWARMVAGTMAALLIAAAIPALSFGAHLSSAHPSPAHASQNPATPSAVTVSGVVSDSRCGAKHSMETKKSPAECARVCQRRGAKYVMVNGDTVYELVGDQTSFDAHAGRRVSFTGTLVGNVLHVDSIQTE
jgi:hypothetical protein